MLSWQELDHVFSSGLSNIEHGRSSVVRECLLTCRRKLDVLFFVRVSSGMAVMDITIVVEFVLLCAWDSPAE